MTVVDRLERCGAAKQSTKVSVPLPQHLDAKAGASRKRAVVGGGGGGEKMRRIGGGVELVHRPADDGRGVFR